MSSTKTHRILFILCCLLSYSILTSRAQESAEKIAPDEILASRDTSFNNVHYSITSISRDSLAINEFIDKCRKEQYYEGLSLALNSWGISLRNASKYEESIRVHEEAIEFAKKTNQPIFEAACLNMLGVVHRRTDRVKEALDYHQEALEKLEKSKSIDRTVMRSLAVSHNSIGNIYLTMREGDLALKEFLVAMDFERSIDNKRGLAINYHNIGGIYEEKGELEKAKEYFEISLDYNNQINSDYGRVICKNSIGHIFLLQGDYARAHDLVKPTIEIAEEGGDMFYIVETYTNMGWAEMGLGNLKSASYWLTKALKGAKERNLQFYVAEDYKLLAKLAEKEGRFKDAYEFSQLFFENEKKYLNEENQNYVSNLILKYDSEKKKSRIELLEKENQLVNLKLFENRIIFSAAVLALLLGCLLLYFLYRQNKLKSEKELIHMEQTMLRSQMNPHFIFNSLNSIKLYIISNEKDKAVYYLNKFSKLIRKILNNSQESNITLKEELETMELYMNIENIRFSNKINYFTHIDPQVNTSQVKIPSMILQPFLENAIWHGLSSVTREKTLNLRILKASEDFIHIEIQDNGVGRNKSKEIKAGKTLQRKSIGIKLTEQRLQNFYKKLEGSHHIEILDHLDAEGGGTGTTVILKIPHKEQYPKTLEKKEEFYA